MNQEKITSQLPAPCIIDFGTIVDREDMKRLLHDLGRVRYVHTLDEIKQSESEGLVQEVFAHPHRSTLVANHSIYLNIQSFDYLQIHKSKKPLTSYDLIKDNRQLRLIPLCNFVQDRGVRQNLQNDFEEMLTDVLSSKWDMSIDDDDCPF